MKMGTPVPFSFKLEFPYPNNATEFEAYLAGLAIVLGIGIEHIRVLGDSNLVVSQGKGDFVLREPSLASYQIWAKKVEERFQTISMEYAQRSEN